MITIDLSEYVYSTNVQQYDGRPPYDGESEHNTIGFTIDVKGKDDPLYVEIKKLSKKYNAAYKGEDFCWVSKNMRFIGRGYIFKTKLNKTWKSLQLKVSFRTDEYITLKGRSLIRDYTLNQLVGD